MGFRRREAPPADAAMATEGPAARTPLARAPSHGRAGQDTSMATIPAGAVVQLLAQGGCPLIRT
jgi:hypothetical protein